MYKKILLVLFLFFSLIFSGCQNLNENDNNSNNNDSQKKEDVKNETLKIVKNETKIKKTNNSVGKSKIKKTKKKEKPTISKRYKRTNSISNIQTMMIQGVQRQFLIYKPDNLIEDASVIFSFHGSMGQSNLDRRKNENYILNKIAKENNVVIVYPLSLKSNNAFFWSRKDHPVNLKFFDELLKYLKTNIPKTNSNKIYITGHSSGAIFSFFLAGERANKISAAVSAAGQMRFKNGAPDFTKDGISIPFRAYNGVEDPLVNFNSATENIEIWHTKENEGSLNNPEITNINIEDYQIEVTKYKGGLSDLEFYAIKNVGHGINWNIIGNSMWEFMKSHVKNN